MSLLIGTRAAGRLELSSILCAALVCVEWNPKHKQNDATPLRFFRRSCVETCYSHFERGSLFSGAVKIRDSNYLLRLCLRPTTWHVPVRHQSNILHYCNSLSGPTNSPHPLFEGSFIHLPPLKSLCLPFSSTFHPHVIGSKKYSGLLT